MWTQLLASLPGPKPNLVRPQPTMHQLDLLRSGVKAWPGVCGVVLWTGSLGMIPLRLPLRPAFSNPPDAQLDRSLTRWAAYKDSRPQKKAPEEWAQFDCPEEVRQAFRFDTSPHCINKRSISKQTQSLFFLDLLVIAHDLLDRRSLSDLYRLRIVRSCSQLVMRTSTVYHEKLLSPDWYP
ncbi:hypothetical protein J4Q44_G00008270 [Coregonus suidteri]|uniref:Uncharacterized protein n=1 Tax=Coregonus suidteri TaxID=861788 RepID=A0AAN8RAH2_9TELE